MSPSTFAVLAALAALAAFAAIAFNRLIAKRQMANNGWADIGVQLKRRADLIPRLVSTVRAYADHERQLFEDLATKRAAALAAGDDVAKRSGAEAELSRPVARLVAVAEAYPELKASQNFLDLQNELSETENKIEMARRFYNGAVRELNTLVQSFPFNIVAGMFGIAKRAYFEADETDRALPSAAL